jgi:hypothetical protein
MASERLGFYLVSTKGERTPLCDVVSYGSSGDRAWHNALYTGPSQKSITAIKHHRTPGEVAAYEKHREVGLENDIAAGGYATIVHSRKRKSYDIWLFGPLSFLGGAYGSLIIELSGYQPRKIFSKRDSWDKITYWTEFPKSSPGSFRHCKVMETELHLQAGKSKSSVDIETLSEKRMFARPAILLPYVRVDWTVVSQIASQTDCALYEQEGLN